MHFWGTKKTPGLSQRNRLELPSSAAWFNKKASLLTLQAQGAAALYNQDVFTVVMSSLPPDQWDWGGHSISLPMTTSTAAGCSPLASRMILVQPAVFGNLVQGPHTLLKPSHKSHLFHPFPHSNVCPQIQSPCLSQSPGVRELTISLHAAFYSWITKKKKKNYSIFYTGCSFKK